MKFLPFLILMTVLIVSGFNSSDAKTPNNAVSVSSEDDNNNSIDIGLDYSSNNNAYGHVNVDTKQITLSPNLTYTAPFGLFFSGTVSRISNSDTTGSLPSYNYALETGYDFSLFNDKLTISPSYSHFFHSDNSEALTTLINNQYALGFLAGGKHFKGKLNASYLSGSYNDYPINLGFSVPIRFKNIFFNDARLSFSPGASVYFGKQTFNQFLLVKSIQSFLDKARKKHPTYDPTLAELQKDKIYKKIQKLEKGVFNTDPDPTEKLSDFIKNTNSNMPNYYGFTSIGFSVPVTYILNDLFINVTPSGLIPYTLTQTINKKTKAKKLSSKPDGFVFYISAGITYTFDW